ncbi:MAG: hypothetical protein HYR94_23130, partial [Chloroflexi bacterium]|nr:hypothetical protein [Chloroflexota bacterium]
MMQINVIAISGAAGAGKTTLVRKVADLLGDATVLHFDDYQSVARYPQFPTDFPRWVEEGKDLDAWKIPQLLDDLKALRAGKTIVLPTREDKVQPARFIVLVEYFSLYSLAREYYLTIIERVRQDCDLILDGTRPTEELAQEIVTVIRSYFFTEEVLDSLQS